MFLFRETPLSSSKCFVHTQDENKLQINQKFKFCKKLFYYFLNANNA